MQLNLRPLFNFLRQQESFDWKLEQQKIFDEIITLPTERYQTRFRIQINLNLKTELAQHYYNNAKVQTKYTLSQQIQDYLHKPNLALLQL